MSGQPRFCEHCGAPILPQARFCENCGHPISGAPAPSPQEVDDSAPTRQVAKAPEPARKTPFVAILVAALVLVAAAVAFMALRKPTKPAGEVLGGAVPVAATPVPAPELPTPVPPPTAAPDALSAAAAQAAAAQTAAAQAAAAQAAAARAAAPRPRPTPPIVATYQCRVGVKFDVEPEEAEVAVDGRAIGTVEDLDDGYTFEQAGTYYLRFEEQGYKTLWVKVVCRPEAEEDYYEISRELEEIEEE